MAWSPGDGNLNATVLLRFPSGEQLRVDIFSPGGVTAAQPPVLEYNAQVSGSYPQDFDASQLLRLALSLQEDPAGMLQGQQVLSGNVTISVRPRNTLNGLFFLRCIPDQPPPMTRQEDKEKTKRRSDKL